MSHKQLTFMYKTRIFAQEKDFSLRIKELGVQKHQLGNFCLSYQFPPKSMTKVAFFFELCKNV